MKKFASVLLLIIICSLASCGGNNRNTENNDGGTIEERDFGGAGSDPSNGTTISEDSAMVEPSGTTGRLDLADTTNEVTD